MNQVISDRLQTRGALSLQSHGVATNASRLEIDSRLEGPHMTIWTTKKPEGVLVCIGVGISSGKGSKFKKLQLLRVQLNDFSEGIAHFCMAVG